VLPFLVNRIPDGVRQHVDRVVLLGASGHAAFEFHVADWFGANADRGMPTRPEISRMTVPITCVDPEDEPQPVCDAAVNPRVSRLRVGRGHHFGGQYDRLAAAILH
jgi:type IV secretory pathway VirJ component